MYIRALVIENGHTLWAARIAQGGVLIYCSVCWAYASASPFKLAKPCCGPPVRKPCARGKSHVPFGETARTRILRRQHPSDVEIRLLPPARL